MKYLLLTFTLLFNYSLISAQAEAPVEFRSGVTVTCYVSGYDSDDGQTRSGLYNSSETFLKKTFRHMTTTIHNNQAVLIFYDVPPGEYAASLYHDANKNGDFDRTFGIPVEDYAVSNNAKRMFSAPSFDEAKFEVGKEDIEIYFSF